MTVLFILNDPPYGTERAYNALRLAAALLKADPATRITVFLIGDPVIGAQRGQKTPEGFYSIERMLNRVRAGGGQILLCGTCMDARGFTDAEVMDGAARGTRDGLEGAPLASGHSPVSYPAFHFA